MTVSNLLANVRIMEAEGEGTFPAKRFFRSAPTGKRFLRSLSAGKRLSFLDTFPGTLLGIPQPSQMQVFSLSG
jgi:hypothetical protein